MTELVSILTPSFNQARWLRQNLRSVADQTYPRIEHIVMDGGSTDGGLSILERSGANVHWRSEPDKGQSHALNKALAASRGEIIGWLNSDDAYYCRDVVGMAVQAFRQHPEISIVYGHSALVNAEGLLLQMIWVPRFRPQVLRTHNFIIQPAAFIRRSILSDTLVDEAFDYAMDRELWLRLADNHNFLRLNRVVAIDRHHRERKSLLRDDLARLDTERLIEIYQVPHGPLTKLRLKALKIAYRLAGLSLIGQARKPFVWDGQLDSLANLSLRQAFVVRAAMPDGRISHS